MNIKKILEIKERTDRAYGILSCLAEDDTQTKLVRIITREARNHVSAVLYELDTIIERRVK